MIVTAEDGQNMVEGEGLTCSKGPRGWMGQTIPGLPSRRPLYPLLLGMYWADLFSPNIDSVIWALDDVIIIILYGINCMPPCSWHCLHIVMPGTHFKTVGTESFYHCYITSSFNDTQSVSELRTLSAHVLKQNSFTFLLYTRLQLLNSPESLLSYFSLHFHTCS